MFSKKKKAKDLDMILVDDVDQDRHEQRDAFRYVFESEERLSISFKGKMVEIFNISAGGLAFKNQGFDRYESDTVSLALDIPNFIGNPVFSAQARILHISSNHLCHCIFENCTVDDYEIIHKYVLEMQKQKLNSR